MDTYSPFEIGDLIRRKFTEERYLIIANSKSTRTGNTIGYKVIDLKKEDYININYQEFDNYVIDV